MKDFKLARSFYQSLLDVELREASMGGARMAIFPGSCEQTGGCLVVMPDYEPSQNGSVVYLRTPGDLQTQLDRAPELGGLLASGLLAALGCELISYLLYRFAFDLVWQPHPWLLVLPLLLLTH